MLPGLSGEELLRKLREERRYSFPVLILSAKSALGDKVALLKPFPGTAGTDAGADIHGRSGTAPGHLPAPCGSPDRALYCRKSAPPAIETMESNPIFSLGNRPMVCLALSMTALKKLMAAGRIFRTASGFGW